MHQRNVRFFANRKLKLFLVLLSSFVESEVKPSDRPTFTLFLHDRLDFVHFCSWKAHIVSQSVYGSLIDRNRMLIPTGACPRTHRHLLAFVLAAQRPFLSPFLTFCLVSTARKSKMESSSDPPIPVDDPPTSDATLFHDQRPSKLSYSNLYQNSRWRRFFLHLLFHLTNKPHC